MRRGLAEIVIDELAEIERRRVQYRFMHWSLGQRNSGRFRHHEINEPAAGLRPMTQVHDPFLIPNSVQCRFGGRAERSDDVRSAERAERLLIFVSGVRICLVWPYA